jgi:hypothetical protein
MSCSTAYSSGNFATPRSHVVADYLNKNSDIHFVDHAVFTLCFPMIRPWIDLSALSDYLYQYGVVKDGDDMQLLTSSYFKPQDKMNSLIQLVEEAGSDGYMLLYMSLRESSVDNPGHKDAVEELDRCGM